LGANARGSSRSRLPYGHDHSPKFGRATIDPANRFDPEVIARADVIDVETRRIDDYDLADVGFIKIDVEGHELAVLAGAENTLMRHTPNLLIECNDEHQPNAVSRLGSWLEAQAYDAVFIQGRELRPINEYQREIHWTGQGVENFIAIHRSRPDVFDRLAARVSQSPRG
jgi:hypothetical protein